MSDIVIAIFGYFLISLEAVFSKFLLTGRMKSWQLYVFYVGVLAFFTLLLFPFGLRWYGWQVLGYSLLSGATFFFYLVMLYRELEKQPASVVYVVSGAVCTVGVLLLSGMFLGELFSHWQLAGIGLLLVGGVLLAFKPDEFRFIKGTGMIVISGLMLAVSMVMLKFVYGQQNFISGYIYTRLGEVVAVAGMFAVPVYRKAVFKALKRKKRKRENTKQFIAVTSAKTLSGIGTLLVNVAIFSGSVTIVNALRSMEYLFIFVFSIILTMFFKRIFAEDLRARHVLMNVAGLLLVIIGVWLVR